MTRVLICLIAAFSSPLLWAEAPAKSKEIIISKASFSDFYPAVWLNPATGETSVVNGETPPKESLEIWLEPGDPEIQMAPGLKSDKQFLGFVSLGDGEDVFDAAYPSSDPQPERDKFIKSIPKTELLKPKSVFRYYGKTASCVLIIEEVDKENEVIKLKWKPITIPPVAKDVKTDQTSLLQIPYDARKLTAELAFYTEVKKADFYYLSVFPKAHVQGTATLSTGQSVEWFHYECGGLYLRFKDASERYFLHPTTVAELKAAVCITSGAIKQ